MEGVFCPRRVDPTTGVQLENLPSVLFDTRTRPWYLAALRQGGPALTGAFSTAATSLKVISVSNPMYTAISISATAAAAVVVAEGMPPASS